jgi:predicted outer membrane repeat protein
LSLAGKLTIKDSCSFTLCSSTNGNGGAIYASLSTITTGGLYIVGSGTTLTTFSQCTASQLGGAIYLELESGTEDYFNLSGASYS